jgi:hypothetical protein
VSWPAGTVKETAVVAPTTGVLVVVEVEGAVEDVVGTDDSVVAVGAFTAWFRPPEQLVAATARATRTTPVVALIFMSERIGRR